MHYDNPSHVFYSTNQHSTLPLPSTVLRRISYRTSFSCSVRAVWNGLLRPIFWHRLAPTNDIFKSTMLPIHTLFVNAAHLVTVSAPRIRLWLLTLWANVLIVTIRGVESELDDSDSEPYLFQLDFCAILLQCIWLLCNLFCNWNAVCKIFVKLSLSTQSLCHTISPRVEVGVEVWTPKFSKPGFGVGVRIPGHHCHYLSLSSCPRNDTGEQ